ncbi:ATP-binding protein [Flavobacterium sp.]|uniref:sensor histidine kinase n=1 Tax=Flavobacterium sp. TaxID=239 RepID=UPI0022C9C641|nr:ATP-binding protein [Flavobacterium sp.]MCZ8169088.1 ATP-binding protein [Flavobacterium sp.]
MVKNQEIEAQTRKHLLRGIAMEIHDNVLNRLASTRYQLFKLHFKQDKQTLHEAMEGIDHIQQVENELRLLTHNLTNESQSATISLLSMIQELIDIHHEVYDQEVEFTVSQWDWEQLPNETKINCLRIVQEALLNITKHAKATRISIQFIHDTHHLRFRISDNGKGMEAVKTIKGIGLKNLEERAQMMAAKIEIYSTPAEGTTLQITLPI